MSYIRKALLENEENQRRISQIAWEITGCIRQSGRSIQNMFPLIPYLLYKTSLYDKPLDITLQSIVAGVIDVNEDVRFIVKELLDDSIWERLLQLVNKYSPEEFAMVAISSFYDNEQKGTMSTPRSIIRLAQKLLGVKKGEKVADVCCGTGSYIVSAAVEEPNASYHGYEINTAERIAAMIKAELYDVNVEITLGDIFSLTETNDIPKYDKIFSNYPFGLQLRNLGAGAGYLDRLAEQYPGLSKATSSDWVFNSLLCDMLEENGKAIGIMTNGSTWNSIDIPMRKYFVERKMIECVIALPARMFAGTNISTTLIVLSHNNDTIRMIDATNLYQQGRRQNELSDEDIVAIIDAINTKTEYSRSISIEELRENEYALSLGRYISQDLKFNNGVSFESVIKNISRGAPCTASQLDEMVSDKVTNMQYLMLANIKDGMIDDKLPYLSSINPKYEKYCLKNNTLILSKNGYPYKVAVASVKEDQRILANGNLYIIELDEEKANPYYLKAFFDSEQGVAVLKSITVGATIPNIGVDKLKKVEIPLPSLEEQNRIAQKYQATLDEISVIKLRLEKAINKLHHIFEEDE